MMTDDHSPYFDYVSWKDMAAISTCVSQEDHSNPMLFTLKLLAIVYDTEEEILKEMLVTDIIKLRDSVEKGTPADVEKTKKWLISHIKEKYEVDRFELMEFD